MTYEQWLQSLTPEQRYNFDSEGRGYKKDASVMMRLAWDAATAECKAKVMAAAQGYDIVPGRPYSNEFEAAHGVLVGVAAAL